MTHEQIGWGWTYLRLQELTSKSYFEPFLVAKTHATNTPQRHLLVGQKTLAACGKDSIAICMQHAICILQKILDFF